MRIKNAPLVHIILHQGGVFMKSADQNRLICGRNKLFPYFLQARGASVPVRAHVFSDPVYKRAAVFYAVCARQPCPKLQKALLGKVFRILNGKILPEKAKYFFVIFLIDLAEQRGDLLLFHSLKKRFISVGGRHGLHDPQRAPAAFYGLTGGKKQLSAFQQGGCYIQLKR